MTAAKPLVNKLPIVEQRRVELKARLASKLAVDIVTRACRLWLKERIKAERDISRQA